MKKFIALTIVLSIFMLCGCSGNQPNKVNPTDAAPASSTDATAEDVSTSLPDDLFVPASTIIRAGWTEDAQVVQKCLNKDAVQADPKTNLPVYKIDSLEELTKFKDDTKSFFTWHYFDEISAKKYDEDFFKDNYVLFIYKTATSGSFSFKVKGASYKDSAFTVYVEQKEKPEVYTTDMAGWFVVVSMSRAKYADCKTFAAQFLG